MRRESQRQGGRRARLVAAALVAGAAIAAGAAAREPVALASGRLHEEVATAADPARTYALYLPSALDGARRLPVVFAFDMRDGAAALAATLVPAAERFGWLVAAPHGSSNLDTTAANAARMSAVWADVLARFAVDERRLYVLGFSGMARFACQLAQTAPDRVAGVVGLHGGFPEEAPPSREAAFPFFAVVGERDFSYYELVALEERLESLAVPNRFVHWRGSHEHPPPAVAGRALAWYELRAMTTRLRSRDEALVAVLWGEGVERARSAEAEGEWLAAEREWRALAEDFESLADVAPARERLAALAEHPGLRAEHEAAARRLRRDRIALERVPGLLAAAPARATSVTVADLAVALDIPGLRHRRAQHPERAERDAAERVLYAIYVQAGIYAPRRLSERGEVERAVVLLEVAAEIEPEIPHVRYRLAVAHARLGAERAALAALEQAIDRGWSDRAAIESEPAFAALTTSATFRALLARLPPAP